MTDGKLSRKAAVAVQGMWHYDKIKFIAAVDAADTESDLAPLYLDWLNGGYKIDWASDEKPIEPAEVEPTLEEALKNIIIEWKN